MRANGWVIGALCSVTTAEILLRVQFISRLHVEREKTGCRRWPYRFDMFTEEEGDERKSFFVFLLLVRLRSLLWEDQGGRRRRRAT